MSTPFNREALGEGFEYEQERGSFAARGRSAPLRPGPRPRRSPVAPRYRPAAAAGWRPSFRPRPRPRPWLFLPGGFGYPPIYPYPYPSPPEYPDGAAPPPPAAAPGAEPGPPPSAAAAPPPPDVAEPGVEPPPAAEPAGGESPAEPELFEEETGAPGSAPTCAHPLVHTAMPASGPGFYSYTRASRRFGMAEMVDALMRVGAGWAASYSRGPRIGMGDLSFRCGGAMPPHGSHRRGVDIDIRPVRSDGREGPVAYNDPTYSRALTQDLVNRLRANGRLRVQYIFFNDPGITGVRTWPGHHNHLHVRFLPPPGVTPELEMPELADELELAKQGPVSATLAWQKVTIAAYPPSNIPTGGGLYIVERGVLPIYVGETNSFQRRWRGRLDAEWQIGRIDPGPLARELTLWFGTLSPARENVPKVRRAVEHAIVRTLSRGYPGLTGRYALRNRRSFREFEVVAPMNIQKLLPATYASRVQGVPHYSGNVLKIDVSGTRYELLLREGAYEQGA
jgi:Penicillin-insensitive murein endopeptidase